MVLKNGLNLSYNYQRYSACTFLIMTMVMDQMNYGVKNPMDNQLSTINYILINVRNNNKKKKKKTLIGLGGWMEGDG